MRKIDAPNNKSSDDIIPEWNQTYAHILVGDKSCILREFKTPEGHTDFNLMSSAAFREWNGEFVIVVGKTKDGKPRIKPAADFWLHHPKRRKYEGIGFYPDRDVPGYYNLWRGFAVEPKKGDCSKFLAHVFDNVCQRDDELYAWVTCWFADIFQRPAIKCETALALRGKPGTGKTKVGSVIGSLLGPHYRPVSDSQYVTGRFNKHMFSLVLLHSDEGFWAGDKKAEGKLKDLVTGKTHPIEFKGKDVFWIDNYVRLLVTGNPDWIVPAAFEERRFAVLDMGEEHMQDHAYFAAIDEEMNNGGREALLYHLLYEVDCSKVNLRQIPHTMALIEQKLEGANPEQAWWIDILREGILPGDWHGTGSAPSALLFDHYIEHAQKRGVARKSIETALGIFLGKVVGDTLRREKQTYLGNWYHRYSRFHVQERKRGLVYIFPTLKACRNHFAALLGEDLEWPEGDDWVPAQDEGSTPAETAIKTANEARMAAETELREGKFKTQNEIHRRVEEQLAEIRRNTRPLTPDEVRKADAANKELLDKIERDAREWALNELKREQAAADEPGNQAKRD